LVLLFPRDAQRDEESGEDGLSCMRFEEALLSLTRNGQARLTEQQKKPEREKRVRENENEGILVHSAW